MSLSSTSRPDNTVAFKNMYSEKDAALAKAAKATFKIKDRKKKKKNFDRFMIAADNTEYREHGGK